MIFARIELAAFALLPSFVLASGSDVMIGFERRGAKGVVLTLFVATSKLDELLSEAGTQPITDLDQAQQLISSCKDISISVAAGMNTFSPGSGTRPINPDGNKISLVELGEDYGAYQKNLVVCILRVKDTRHVKVDDMIQEMALHVNMTQDDMERLSPEVANMTTILNANKTTQDAMATIIGTMLGSVDSQ
ncbi:unnamed protein product [Rhizoctonia solani]|uniref:Uncharacterized protein n=1 Tax=Rhizoctonia solani TaxID=456999 RepID=A0A8H3H8H8_9AGAM|nr:unnamed protein product [Rhizoctonia solani]